MDEGTLRRIKLCGDVIEQSRRMSLCAPVDDDFPAVKHDFDSAVLAYAKAIAPAAPSVVTEEMVERACVRWVKDAYALDWNTPPGVAPDLNEYARVRYLRWMRAALHSALGERGKDK